MVDTEVLPGNMDAREASDWVYPRFFSLLIFISTVEPRSANKLAFLKLVAIEKLEHIVPHVGTSD
jgi:hypothetical protein